MADVLHALGNNISTRYRQTPFREHVERQMGWSDGQSWRSSLQDVLALEELRQRIEQYHGPVPQLRKVLTLEQFFYHSNLPGMVSYLPVKVRNISDNSEYADLTALIQHLDRQKQNELPGSILLVARSGSGKTVAARKAFCDCVVATPGETRPLLGDYLPCWISAGTEGNQDELRDVDDELLIERLILRACHLRARDISQSLSVQGFQRWLDQPQLKLLLFFDLNSWGADGREKIARELPNFLTRYDVGGRRVGHRAVVAYRSAADDGPLVDLEQSRQFLQYDLLPLRGSQAQHYLRNIRQFEQEVYRQIDRIPPQRDDEAEVQFLRTLLKRHGGKREGAESLISTPLLMHFCSLLAPDKFVQVQTLNDRVRTVKWLLAGCGNLGGFPTRSRTWREGGGIRCGNGCGGSEWIAGGRVG